MRVTCLLILAAFLGGCAETIAERQPVEIDVVPVYYSVEVKLKKLGEKGARPYLDKFVEQHWNLIASQPVELNWTTKAGKKMAESYKKRLVALGVAQSSLLIAPVTEPDADKAFDLQLRTSRHHAVMPVCGYYRLGTWGRGTDGCFAESARWLSMSNPHKALSGKD